MALLEIENLAVQFPSASGTVYAVRDLSYSIESGETLAVIGESGSGKSVHALAIAGLLPLAAQVSGAVRFLGSDLLKASERELRHLRGSKIGFVFQNPMDSLNPVLTVGQQIADSVRTHLRLNRKAAYARGLELLERVQMPEPTRTWRMYPHQLSGGLQQRVCIAIAIACEPRLLIADEPTTALDVTVQAGIVELIHTLKRQLGMAVLWITHDLALTASIADTIQVMYAGKILERGPKHSIFRDPRNAYTQALLQAIPSSSRSPEGRLALLPGSPPSVYEPLVGDPFAPRNRFATERCFRQMPPLLPVEGGDPKHWAAAWYELRQANQRTESEAERNA
jgi:peptide/nickel transport system ATP-binding protein/oligopeptide transport system ATP-binding protein